jgi:hypothetical protein
MRLKSFISRLEEFCDLYGDLRVLSVNEEGNLSPLSLIRVIRVHENKIMKLGPHFFAKEEEECDCLALNLKFRNMYYRGGREE